MTLETMALYRQLLEDEKAAEEANAAASASVAPKDVDTDKDKDKDKDRMKVHLMSRPLLQKKVVRTRTLLQ